ncbi:apolipoprotein N-acyltransferase [Aeromicrobium sp. CTD01-1L150]|uniref:apolipoprotein N-acyltransferase n=1 Tax=Aeromicrobium sp. CTD01-1L150 TaxID=3341830 RepID=UPI0035C1B53D
MGASRVRRPVVVLSASLAAGALAAAAFPPVGLGWSAPLAMASLWVLIRDVGLGMVAGHGLAFGLAFFLLHVAWLDASIGLAAWLLLSVTQSVFLTVAALGVRAVSALPAAPLWGAGVWIGVESLRASWPLGGLPWGRLGYTVVDTPWAGALATAGVSGSGFLVVLTGFAIGETLARGIGRVEHTSIWRAGLGVVAAAVTLGLAVLPPEVEASGSIRVAVVQGGVPGDGTELVRFHREVTRNHVAATEQLGVRLREDGQRVDLVLWPENATAVDPLRDADTRAMIEGAARAVGAPILVGAIVDGPTQQSAYNRGLLWDARDDDDRRPVQAYTKQHLVPFGEYIPWRSVIGNWSSRFSLVPRDMLPGPRSQTISIGGVRFAAAICFDVAYDDVVPEQVARGAEIVAVQTSNATFFGTTQLEQQFAITRARAVESGRSVVVASTNGISAMIGPDGSVRRQAPVGGTEVLIDDVELSDQLTPAVRWQTARQWALVALAGVGLAWSATMGWRFRSTTGRRLDGRRTD